MTLLTMKYIDCPMGLTNGQTIADKGPCIPCFLIKFQSTQNLEFANIPLVHRAGMNQNICKC